MDSPSITNDTLLDEFHNQEAVQAGRVRLLACSILTSGIILAWSFIYCLRQYRLLSIRIHARVADGGLDFLAACLVPLLVWFWGGCEYCYGGGQWH